MRNLWNKLSLVVDFSYGRHGPLLFTALFLLPGIAKFDIMKTS